MLLDTKEHPTSHLCTHPDHDVASKIDLGQSMGKACQSRVGESHVRAEHGRTDARHVRAGQGRGKAHQCRTGPVQGQCMSVQGRAGQDRAGQGQCMSSKGRAGPGQGQFLLE